VGETPFDMNFVTNMKNVRTSNVETTLTPFDIPQNWISSENLPFLARKFPKQQASGTAKDYSKYKKSVIIKNYVPARKYLNCNKDTDKPQKIYETLTEV
jgi:hypothetical protein